MVDTTHGKKNNVKKFKVTGISGQTEVIEAHSAMDASKQFIEHHNDMVTSNYEIVTEEDTSHV